MILIADSGSTKTDWCIIKSPDKHNIYKTDGINPFLQDEKCITEMIENCLLPHIDKQSINEIYFYGAGCTKEKSVVVKDALSKVFGNNINITVDSDLYGAAIALCGNKPGIACILGTGSNSCEFDGNKITKHVSPLGFILGDEGGGAYIGKRFISDCIKGDIPKNIYDDFAKEYHLSEADIIDKVYKESFPNRFLATFTLYIYKKRNEISIHNLLIDSFSEFFRRNVLKYDIANNINIIGSIAFYFQEEIKEAANLYDLKIGKVVKTPIEALIEHYSSSMKQLIK